MLATICVATARALFTVLPQKIKYHPLLSTAVEIANETVNGWSDGKLTRQT